MTLRIFGPEELGGIGDIQLRTHAISQKTGQSEKELIQEVTVGVVSGGLGPDAMV
jgi:hypothetical protein